MRATWPVAHVNKPGRGQDGCLTRPVSDAFLEEIGRWPISHYADVRRYTIALLIVDGLIFEVWREGERKGGNSPLQWWWEQPMHLDERRALVDSNGNLAVNQSYAEVAPSVIGWGPERPGGGQPSEWIVGGALQAFFSPQFSLKARA